MTPNGITPKILHEKNFDKSTIHTNLIYYKNGCIISDSNGKVRFIKKINNTDWSEIWTVLLDNPVYDIHWITSSDKLYAINSNGNLLKLEENNEFVEFKEISEERYDVKYFEILNPNTKYVVIVNHKDEIILLDIINGKTVSTFIIY